MYLFSRNARLGEGNPQKQLDWALRITEKVNQISEIPVQLWTTVSRRPRAGWYGPPLSRISSSSRRSRTS